jgi:hypothetical protein
MKKLRIKIIRVLRFIKNAYNEGRREPSTQPFWR